MSSASSHCSSTRSCIGHVADLRELVESQGLRKTDLFSVLVMM